jgi:uncharacterized lipoprotein YmbA
MKYLVISLAILFTGCSAQEQSQSKPQLSQQEIAKLQERLKACQSINEIMDAVDALKSKDIVVTERCDESVYKAKLGV